MKCRIKKYQTYTSAVILAGYLSLCLLNVFHHHNIAIVCESSINSDKLNGSQQINSSGFECSVHQNFNSIHTLTFTASFFIIDTNQSGIQRLIISSNTYSSNNFCSSNHLRAPPEIS